MTEKVWNIAAYCRLSCDDGDKAESNSIGSRKDIFREFLRDRTNMIIAKESVNDGYSGVCFIVINDSYDSKGEEMQADHDKKIQEMAAKNKGSMDNRKQTVLRLESKMMRNQSESVQRYEA